MGNAESLAMENENPESQNATQTPPRTRRRGRRRNSTQRRSTSKDENSWWTSIENENFTLGEVPHELASLTNASDERNLSSIDSKIHDESINVALKVSSFEDFKSNGADVNPLIENAKIEKPPIDHKNFNDENASASVERMPTASSSASAREQSLEEFKEELRLKRIARQTAVQNLRDEIMTLRKQLSTEQALNRSMRSRNQSNAVNKSPDDSGINDNLNEDCSSSSNRIENGMDTDDIDPMSRGRHANIELANAQLALQLANSENISLRAELAVVQKQVSTLKEVVSCCKQMLAVKEQQCNELKAKLTEIETSFSEHETKIMSDNLRHEYERQLGNIRQLRELYEERQRISAAEHENLQRLIAIKKDELAAEQEKTKSFEERNQTLIKEVESANKELVTLREECNEHKFEKKALKEEMGAVNTLFSQMVMGFNGENNLDIDRLATMLEENRSLLNEMATKEVSCTDGATLPKLLFELVEQATLNGSKRSRSSTPAHILDDATTATTTIATSTQCDDEKTAEENERQQEQEIGTKNHHNGNATSDLNNDTAVEQHIEISDAATSICYGAADSDQVNIAGSTTSNSNNCCTVVFKKGQQRRSNSNSSNSKIKSCHAAAAAAAGACAGVTETLSSSPSPSPSPSSSTLNFREPEVIGKVASTQEIIGNLPKVWKVLMELLSHHRIEKVQFEESGNSEDCYKSVETPNGPKAELSVSKTYIKLKDLILEKKSLVKETNRLKTLNSHLECRLNTQEKRLSAVSMELTKTWHLVGKMQRQHRQLHTQEQILRYQLQQKRRLLSELKEELEYCRRKWAAARAKNDESQEQCNDLRREFARRKLEDANNSAESGYSDSGPPSDDEENSGDGGGSGSVGAVGGCVNSRRKHLREMFEHSRKIKRMQSTSPGRAAAYREHDDGASTAATLGNDKKKNNNGKAWKETEIVLRWNSAPPTCGWRRRDNRDGNAHADNADDVDDDDDDVQEELQPRLLVLSRGNNGAIPKQHRERRHVSSDAGESDTDSSERTTRIQRLEEQCKSLIQQVLETSDNRERLEVQLCRFQDEIAPVQYAVPLEEFISKRRTERMSRASSAPAPGSLTAREEEYTRKRSERLERLEEESRQLMSRIRRTSDRGHYLRCSLDRIRRMPMCQGSFESETEDDIKRAKASECAKDTKTLPEENANEKNPLTAEEEAYTARRTARLQRLEEEGRQLLGTLSRTAQHGESLETKLDNLHERYGENSTSDVAPKSTKKESNIEQRLEEINQVTANRAERLRQLEEEGNELIARLSSTSARGTRMINRIAEREQRREARMNATANSSDAVNETMPQTSGSTNETTPNAAVTATALLPTLKNVACSSIVSDEVTECVTVTTIPSQVATRELGAVPKSSVPTSQLCAARHKSERFTADKTSSNDKANCSKQESLEDMVRRLRDTPFPEKRKSTESDETEEAQRVEDENENENREKKKSE